MSSTNTFAEPTLPFYIPAPLKNEALNGIPSAHTAHFRFHVNLQVGGLVLRSVSVHISMQIWPPAVVVWGQIVKIICVPVTFNFRFHGFDENEGLLGSPQPVGAQHSCQLWSRL